jgi:hypothetical protein
VNAVSDGCATKAQFHVRSGDVQSLHFCRHFTIMKLQSQNITFRDRETKVVSISGFLDRPRRKEERSRPSPNILSLFVQLRFSVESERDMEMQFGVQLASAAECCSDYVVPMEDDRHLGVLR